MSALGHKRTFAVHQTMSALPPIATAKAKFRKGPCLLYPRKRTCAVQLAMSAMGQKRTFRHSLDHFIGSDDQRRRHGKAELAYGANSLDIFRRAGPYVERILRGTKPGDLPVQVLTKFELVVHLNTAEAL